MWSGSRRQYSPVRRGGAVIARPPPGGGGGAGRPRGGAAPPWRQLLPRGEARAPSSSRPGPPPITRSGDAGPRGPVSVERATGGDVVSEQSVPVVEDTEEIRELVCTVL